MRSKDVVELYKQVKVGTRVVICSKGKPPGTMERFGSWMAKWLSQDSPMGTQGGSAAED